MSQRLIPLNQFCREFNISRATAYRKLAAGELRAVKVGAKTCITAAEAQRWLNSLAAYTPTQA